MLQGKDSRFLPSDKGVRMHSHLRQPADPPMTQRLPRIYLAGPEVFLPDARAIGTEKCRLAAEAGFEGAFPLDAQLDLARLPPAEQARRISQANEGLMRSCDALIAN